MRVASAGSYRNDLSQCFEAVIRVLYTDKEV